MESSNELQRLIASSIHAELSKLHPAGSDALSSEYSQALAAATANQLAWYAAEQLATSAVEHIKSFLPAFWTSVDSLDGMDYQGLIQKLAQLAAEVEARHRLIDATAVVLSSQGHAQLSIKDQLLVGNLKKNSDRLLSNCMRRSAPSNFAARLTGFLQSFLASMSHAAGGGEDNVEEDDESMMTTATISDAEATLEAACRYLRCIGLGKLLDETVEEVVNAHVKSYLEDSTGSSDVAVLNTALEYVDTVPLQFLQLVLPANAYRDAAMERWRQHLQGYVREELGALRIDALFDLVIDYPDSLPALQDLRECLRHTRAHRRLVTVFGGAIRARLLHPGAATGDIIQQYVSTIRALQHVDSSGTILSAVSAPLREYLRTRKDAIRCIVTMLTDDEGEEAGEGFLSDLVNDDGAAPAYDADFDFTGPNADEQAYNEILADRWEPGPLEIAPLQISSSEEPPVGDVISMLVNIYGTKELFVSEYRSMLADRLLSKTDFECDKELRTLELLKVRFGEVTLHAAEVMLRDLADSKRINANVRTVSNTATPLKNCQNLVPIDGLSTTIISQLFWPQLPAEDFVLPPEVKRMLDTFGHKYHALKAPRVLQWKPNLGLVSLSLTIGEQQLDFEVSPLHATLLLQFQQHPEWSLADLSEHIKLDPDNLRRKMVYWINQGVVGECRDESGAVHYRRHEELQRPTSVVGMAGEGMEGVDEDTGEPEVDLMASYEPFVIGMLTNFDELSLDRIHNMLKMFVTDPPYDKSMDELSAFLGRLSTEDKVTLEGGVFKRKKE